MNELNIVPIWIVTTLFCIMSYWHGRSEYGWRIVGLLTNIMFGFVFAYLALWCLSLFLNSYKRLSTSFIFIM